MTLSIAVVTMNRAEQLREALESCLSCSLPKETEFVIIDNASTDNTEEIVKETLDNCGYAYYYEKMKENVGAGAGRSYAYAKATGEFVYGLDDDAVIDVKENIHFFDRVLKLFKERADIATVGTQIYDEAWGKNRLESNSIKVCENVYACKMFSGGSHFLRRAAFNKSPYIANRYGYEELPVCLMAADKGYVNVFCSDVRVIHKPKVDKWDLSKNENYIYVANDCAVPYAIKKMMYPLVFRPIIYLAYKKRCSKHLSKIKGLKKQAKQIVKDTISNYKIFYRLKVRTVIKLYKEFGASVF